MLLKAIVALLILNLLNSSTGNVIKIAHLRPNNPNIMHEPHVLKLCAADLKEKNILPPEINLE